MSAIFCCSSMRPYKGKAISHEAKFTNFMAWAAFPRESDLNSSDDAATITHPPYVVQIVKQVNFGPLESKRYFALNASGSGDEAFVEVLEKWLIDANFQKLNTFKNFKCDSHNKFFELNIYQKDPTNAHHWRANIARPAAEIDL
ncbi:hypothetical protein K505DRAFT_350319 [Melanomma pulvis-pyrius CBS 109.77]|uniref:Uncharacterized protein n=1 Tax=Melanomma pulvis-pyrius CBS 109.77 TaxID=1314802 RepID=A0A6A6X9R6_9PLEO|nr:hypothetical protein K505DRAFT_350319 [Melanomma pulvis-pyrius CBS 109.77]